MTISFELKTTIQSVPELFDVENTHEVDVYVLMDPLTAILIMIKKDNIFIFDYTSNVCNFYDLNVLE